MASNRRSARWLAVALVLLAGVASLVGVWAQFFPQSFYTSFPNGRGRWVAVDGPYNEHLVRDVGGLNLALAVVTVVALVHRTAVLVRTAALAGSCTPCPTSSTTALTSTCTTASTWHCWWPAWPWPSCSRRGCSSTPTG
jgi:hypothetical protein